MYWSDGSNNITIDTMCDKLGLVTTIKDRANEIYREFEAHNCTKTKTRNQWTNRDAIFAACVFIACRQQNKPRTLKEIASVANGATKYGIGRAKEHIIRQLGMLEKPLLQEAHAGSDYVRRICSTLGLNNQAIKAVQEAVDKSQQIDIRRSPISVAAAVIYIVTQLSDDQNMPLLKDIAETTGVASTTIKSAYKDLRPFVPLILPNRFYQSFSFLCN